MHIVHEKSWFTNFSFLPWLFVYDMHKVSWLEWNFELLCFELDLRFYLLTEIIKFLLIQILSQRFGLFWWSRSASPRYTKGLLKKFLKKHGASLHAGVGPVVFSDLRTLVHNHFIWSLLRCWSYWDSFPAIVWMYSSEFCRQELQYQVISLIGRVNRCVCKESHLSPGLLQASFRVAGFSFFSCECPNFPEK